MTTESPPELELGREWAALELASLGLSAPGARERFGELLRAGDLDFGRLFDHALRHRLVPLLAYCLQEEELHDTVPTYLHHDLLTALWAHRRTAEAFRAEAARLAEALAEEGVACAFTKGVVLSASIYPDPGTRVMRDVDLLVAPTERDRVAELMGRLDYRIGHFSWRDRALIPLPRETELLYKLSPDHLPHFLRLGPAGSQPYFSVDFALSFTWAKSEWSAPLEPALAEAVTATGADGIELPVLRPESHFLLAVLHLFREAWFERTIRAGKPRLNQFADLVLLWNAEAEQIAGGGFVELVERNGLDDPVRWVLEHVDRLYGTDVVGALGLGGRDDDEWLASARSLNGRPARWHGSMRRRLASREPLTLEPAA